MLPGHPTFSYRGSTGITLGTSSYEHLIAVNQVGKRFFNEMMSEEDLEAELKKREERMRIIPATITDVTDDDQDDQDEPGRDESAA